MSALETVLLIEDNPGDARLVAESLHQRLGPGCRMIHCQTLAEGLGVLGARTFDAVVLDLGLPDSTGLDTFVQVRLAAPRTPVVLLTCDEDEAQAMLAIKTGADDYLSKAQVDGVGLVRALRYAVERREMTGRLSDSEARYRAIVETAEEAILQLSRDGVVLYANARATRLHGRGFGAWDDGPIVAKVSFGRWVAPADQSQADRLLNVAAGERLSCELQLLTPDASPCWVIAAAGGVRPTRPGPTEVVLLLTDITGRKLAEDDVRRLKAELERRVAERTALLESANADLRSINHAMAHDLRSPLHAIVGLTALIMRDPQQPLSENAQRRLRLVEQSARQMNDLIERLLAAATLGQRALESESIDLSAIAWSIARRLTDSEPQRRVHWDIEPDIRAQGDKVLLTQVLQNLIDNAWKYSRDVPEAAIGFRRATEVDGGTVYQVSDNGVGLDMADSQRLFEPFHRLRTAATFEGTGLGLAGVKRAIKRHGGRIWVESSPGHGARFSFTLEGPAPAATGHSRRPAA